MDNGTIRLVVKSRRRLVRDAICAYLAGRPDFAVVGNTGAIDALPDLCVLRRPDAVLVDSLRLTAHTVESLCRVRAAAPAAQLVVTYGEVSPRAIEAAVSAGITALVPGSRGLDAVLRMVRERAHGNGSRRPDGLALTDYDQRILSLLSSGHSVPEMAELLRIGPYTVENHKRRLYVKLSVSSSSQAVSRAVLLGLVDMGRPGGPLPRFEEPGRAPLAVVRGSAGPSQDRVQLALLAAGIPAVHGGPVATLDRAHWARWQRGPTVAVLVDPTGDDWLAPGLLGARTVVVLSANPDLTTLADLVLRGTSALVRGEDVATDLATVLSVVIRGYVAMDAARMDDLVGGLAVRLTDGVARAPVLSARESDVLAAIAGGHTIREAGRLLGITAKTVENAQARLYRKLGARNRSEALTIAHRLGLLDPVLPAAPPHPPADPSPG
jgi:DNA-binding NarL/FixJ family response regulator